MNILTKICIVLMALLSMCVSVVFSRMALVPPSYRQLYQQQKHRAELESIEANNAARAEESANAEVLRLKRENNDLRSDLRQEQQAHEDDLKRLRTELVDKEETVKTLTVKVGNLGDAFNQVEQSRAILTEQLNTAHTRVDRLEDEVTGLQNNLAERNAEIEARIGTERLLNERLTQLQEQYDKLAGAFSAAGGEVPEEPQPPASADLKVTGTITAVSGDMASINVGSVKGIRAGTELLIYDDREGHFIGFLRIIDVSDSESTGQFYDTRRGAVPQVGDKVTTSLR